MFPSLLKGRIKRSGVSRTTTYSPRPDLFVGSPRQVLTVLGLTFVLISAFAYQAFAASPATSPFQRTWQGPDLPVQSGQVSRTWMWGPEGFTGAMQEPYDEAPGGQRAVQYFDKSRMEDNGYRASAPWDVTNGLLVVELMTGAMQVGDDRSEQRNPAAVNVAGDADDPSGPTYATFAELRDDAPLSDGALVIQRVDRDGNVTSDPSLDSYGATAAHRVTEPGIDHQVASPFWAFMNSSDVVYADGEYVTAPLFPSAFYATGLPVTEAYWAEVKVGGTYKDVLMQCFERRCLTFTPDNPEGWQVEAGNVGQHYYEWRYQQGGEEPNPDPSPTPEPSPTPDPSPTPEPTPEPDPTPEPTPEPLPDAVDDYTYQGMIGGPGDPLNDFDKLSGIALAPDGTLVTVDQVSERIQRFTAAGEWLQGFGGTAANKGPTDAPQDVEVDANGNLWILDWGNSRIVRVDENGAVTDSIGDKVSEAALLKHPVGFTIGPDGRFYVADTGNARIVVFDPDGSVQFVLAKGSVRDRELLYPTAVAVDRNGSIFIADQNAHMIHMFDRNADYRMSWGSEGSGESQFKSPTELAIDKNGALYVVDFGNHRIQVFTTDGEYNRTIGELGQGPGQMTSPVDIEVDKDGNVYVAGRDDRYVHKFDSTGEFVTRWSGDGPETLVGPTGVDVSKSGLTYVTDVDPAAIHIFDQEGEHVDTWTEGLVRPLDIVVHDEHAFVYDPGKVVKLTLDGDAVMTWELGDTDPSSLLIVGGIDVDDDGNVYVTDTGNYRVQKFSQYGEPITGWGELGTDDGEFMLLSSLAVNGDEVYVTDAYESRVQIFDLDGNFLRKWGESETRFLYTGVDVDTDGFVYVTRYEGPEIVEKRTPDGQIVTTFTVANTDMPEGELKPLGIAVVGQDEIYVLSETSSAVLKFVEALQL